MLRLFRVKLAILDALDERLPVSDAKEEHLIGVLCVSQSNSTVIHRDLYASARGIGAIGRPYKVIVKKMRMVLSIHN